RLLALVDEGVPTIVCTHGEVVSELVEGLCKEMGREVPDDPGLRKSEFWAAHLADGAMPALERHTPRTDPYLAQPRARTDRSPHRSGPAQTRPAQTRSERRAARLRPRGRPAV